MKARSSQRRWGSNRALAQPGLWPPCYGVKGGAHSSLFGWAQRLAQAWLMAMGRSSIWGECVGLGRAGYWSRLPYRATTLPAPSRVSAMVYILETVPTATLSLSP